MSHSGAGPIPSSGSISAPGRRSGWALNDPRSSLIAVGVRGRAMLHPPFTILES